MTAITRPDWSHAQWFCDLTIPPPPDRRVLGILCGIAQHRTVDVATVDHIIATTVAAVAGSPLVDTLAPHLSRSVVPHEATFPPQVWGAIVSHVARLQRYVDALCARAGVDSLKALAASRAMVEGEVTRHPGALRTVMGLVSDLRRNLSVGGVTGIKAPDLTIDGLTLADICRPIDAAIDDAIGAAPILAPHAPDDGDEDDGLTGVCAYCGETVPREDLSADTDGDDICPACIDAGSVIVCPQSGDLVPAGDAVTVHQYSHPGDAYPTTSAEWSPAAADDDAHRCDDCGNRFTIAPLVRWGQPRAQNPIETARGWTICPQCYSDGYGSCEDCGGIFPMDDLSYHDGSGDQYCSDHYPPDDGDDGDDGDDATGQWHDRAGNRVVWEYHTAKRRGYDPIVDPSDAIARPRTCGVEMEMECVGDARGHIAGDVLASSRIWAGAETDGSLSERRGVELVSHPATLSAWRDAAAALDALRLPSKGVRAHDTDACGLHVHVDRRGVSRQTLARIVRLMRREGEIWQKIWRRAPGQFRHALRTPHEAHMAKKDPKWGARDYLQINPTEHTIEFRAPRGSCRGATVLATVQICHAITEYCLAHSMADVDRTGVAGLVAWMQSRPRVETGAALAYLADPRRGALCPAPKPRRKVSDGPQADTVTDAAAE